LESVEKKKENAVPRNETCKQSFIRKCKAPRSEGSPQPLAW